MRSWEPPEVKTGAHRARLRSNARSRGLGQYPSLLKRASFRSAAALALGGLGQKDVGNGKAGQWDLMLEQDLLVALRAFYARLEKQPVNWAITASCGLALQGLPVRVHDIDLLSDRMGAYRLAQLFADEMARPIQFSATETVQSHYGGFVLVGYTFEIMGDVQFRGADGSWDAPTDFTLHKHFVRVDGMSLPVLTLEYEYESYERLGRVEKVELLADWLSRTG